MKVECCFIGLIIFAYLVSCHMSPYDVKRSIGTCRSWWLCVDTKQTIPHTQVGGITACVVVCVTPFHRR